MAKMTRLNTHRFFPLIFCTAACFPAFSADLDADDIELQPFVETGVTFTNNVNQSADKKSSVITSLAGGLVVKRERGNSALELDYRGEQLLYSHNSDRDEFINNLSFSAFQRVSGTGLRFTADANIDNVSESVIENASNDPISGRTVETRDLTLGVAYQSNSRSYVDLDTFADATYASNDTDNSFRIVDIGFVARDGFSERRVDWLTDLSYSRTDGRAEDDDNTEIRTLTTELGLKPGLGFRPFIRYYDEDVTGVNSGNSDDYRSIGPGVRYFWRQESYVELTYNFALDSDNDDFVGAIINYQPSPNTLLFASYSKRFFGDAYELRLNHEKRRWSNTVSYTEEVKSFDNRFFFNGQIVRELTLNRSLSWISSLRLRRAETGFNIVTRDREAIGSNPAFRGDRSYSASVFYDHDLSRQTSWNNRLGLSRFTFDRDIRQEDDYISYRSSIDHNFGRSVSGSAGFEYRDRQSNTNTDYDELQLFADATFQF